MRIIFLPIILIFILISSLFGDTLPSDISYMINKTQLSSESVSVYVKETKTDKVVASLNVDKQMVPASVEKVYSAYAVLLELGYEYRWATRFYMTGQLRNGVLNGDLVVKGFGDPTLKSSDLPSIVTALKSKGIRKITGNIIIDRTYFNVPKQNSSFFDKNIYSAYNAMPDALMFNEHLSTFSIAPSGGRHQVVKSVPGESYRVVNNIQSVGGGCAAGRSWPSISVDNSGSVATLRVSGALSVQCPKRSYTYIVTSSYRDFYDAFAHQLKRSGIGYGGQMKVARLPASAKILYTHHSDTLEKIISETSKESNNLYARHLLLTLGAKVYGDPADTDKGRRAIAQILNRYRLLDTPKCHIDNGCGLSRVSRITARSLSNVLDHAYQNYGGRWMKTLSIAGVDGTIKRRFQNSSVRNRAWMKTGTLDDAKNIAGYVQSRSGKLYTVVILVNGKQAKWKGKTLEDDIIKWLIEYDGGAMSVASSVPTQEHKENAQRLWGDIDQAATSGKYFVQAGTFEAAPDEKFLSDLDNKTLSYRIINEMGGYKVLIGPYASQAQANTALDTIKKEITTAYVRQL